MNIRRIYEYALGREKEGYRFFSEGAAKASHAAVTSIFERLAREEEMHIRYIQGILARLDEDGPACAGEETGIAEEEGSFFQERAASEMIDQTTAEAMVPDLPVLRMAYLIERDLAEFYQTAASRITGEARASLEKLAAWERDHEKLFKEMHDRIFAEYAEMPWGG